MKKTVSNVASNAGNPQPSPTVQWLEVDDDTAGQRIDNYLLARLKGVPKSLIYRILRKGEVRVNKGRIKPDYKLQAGDVVRVPPVRIANRSDSVRPSDKLAKLLTASILYEDDNVVVINKPSGLAVHGGSGINLGLIESLRQVRESDRFLELVHRLDRDTSGCIMIAKNRRSLRHMQNLLRERGINKVYHALVAGRWPNRRRQVNMSLLKSDLVNGGRIVRAVEDGTAGSKASITSFQVLSRFKGCTLVEAKPITGRTHQIRVHSQYAGHSILGDDKYGDREQDALVRELGLKRLFLHAFKLDFKTVDGQKVTVKAPLDKGLAAVLENACIEHE